MAGCLVSRVVVTATNGSKTFILQSQPTQRAAALVSSFRSDRKQHLHTGNSQMSTAHTHTATKISDVKSFQEIPGPKPLPIIGNLWRFLPLVGEYYGLEMSVMHRKLYNKFGPIVRLAGLPGRPDMVIAFRPEDSEVVFRNEGPWPTRGASSSLIYYREVTRKDYYGGANGVLSENGPKWLETRRKVNPPLMQPRFSKRYVAPISGVAQDFVNRMRTLKDHKDELPADFANELFKWSLESIAYVALDTRLGCLAPVLSPDSEPQRMIDAVEVFFDSLFSLEAGIPIWKIYPTRTWRKYVKALDTFLEISVKYVDEAIGRETRERAEGKEAEPSVLERLLARTSAKEASVMAQDMIFGGVDSTSYSVASALYMISKNQDKQDMLFKELKQHLPRKDDAITEEMLEEMKYLKATLKETLRMASPFNRSMRILPKEIVLDNYKIPAEVMVVMPTTISNESDEIFPQSKRFIPERWLKSRPTEETAGSAEDFDSVHKWKRQPFAFIPFGFGPRSCVGKRFAEMEIEILLAKIVRNFQVEYSYGEMKYESKILHKPKDPLRFKLTERE